ncbi:response regulator [Alcaligenaceae bacterium]|nr:response regulator [Alcaligenaceae bacterium]
MNPPPIQLLVVDDDLLTCARHQAYFESQGYAVSIAHHGDAMWRIIQNQTIALILLDVGLPGKDGLELARELRAHDSNLGIILVSARDDDIDKIVGLESGANDYVTKPFNSRELLARVKNVLRVTQQQQATQTGTLRYFGPWVLNITHRTLKGRDGAHMMLSRGELDLLTTLALASGAILSRDRLMHSISQRAWEASSRTIDVLISRLRTKLEDDPRNPQWIVTVRNQGYVLMTSSKQPST